MLGVLPPSPATPRLRRVSTPVPQRLAPPFPLLLVVPAVAVDLLMRRAGPHHDWTPSLLLGLAFVALFFVAQWFFTEFLLTAHARNFLFGVDQWDYSSRPRAGRVPFLENPAGPLAA